MAHSRGRMVTDPTELKQAARMLDNAFKVALMGTGGNLAIAQHAASDIYRHMGKFSFAPDSVNQTALGGDGDWKAPWLDYAIPTADLIILITCRIDSPAVYALECVVGAPALGPERVLIIAPEKHESIHTLVIESEFYHEFECKALMAIYNMMEECGVELPQLPGKKPQQDVTNRCDVFCFDIDGTLTEPHDNDPWNAVPRMNRIEKINELYDDGCTIYLQTARGYISSAKKYPDDPQAQQRNADYLCRSRTEEQLEEWGVKYHSLYFGKPRASTYIDDRGWNDSEFFALLQDPTRYPPSWHPV